MTVELALTPDSRWNIEMPDLVDAVQSAGFSSLGILGSRVDVDAPAVFSAAGLRCHEIMALAITKNSERTEAMAEQLAAAAAAMDAPWVNTVFVTPLTADVAKLVQRCAAIFADAGVGMAVEFSPVSPITSIARGLEIVQIAGAERAALLIDSWHFSFGDSTWDDLARVRPEQIAYVQFNDGVEPESDDRMHETIDRRVMPGDGIFELDRFATTLLETGWEGTVSVEVLSAELRRLPVPEFIRRAYEAAAPFWS